MKAFYKAMMLLGLIGTTCIVYILWEYAPAWTWWITVPSFLFAAFGAFASRDIKHEFGG